MGKIFRKESLKKILISFKNKKLHFHHWLILQAKIEIRRILPAGLSESISKVRSSVAYAVAAIAHWDWPESWSELFPLMMQGLTSGQPDSVHGVMRVLTGMRLIIVSLYCDLSSDYLSLSL